MAMNRVYMDANATTPLLPEVLAAMRPWFEEKFGNPSSIHFNGQQARSAVDHARESVAAMLTAVRRKWFSPAAELREITWPFLASCGRVECCSRATT